MGIPEGPTHEDHRSLPSFLVLVHENTSDSVLGCEGIYDKIIGEIKADKDKSRGNYFFNLFVQLKSSTCALHLEQ